MGGLVKSVAPRLVHLRHTAMRIPKVLTQTQVRKLIRAAKGPREQALTEVLYGTGLTNRKALQRRDSGRMVRNGRQDHQILAVKLAGFPLRASRKE
jgi:site-specific recombinase XerC